MSTTTAKTAARRKRAADAAKPVAKPVAKTAKTTAKSSAKSAAKTDRTTAKRTTRKTAESAAKSAAKTTGRTAAKRTSRTAKTTEPESTERIGRVESAQHDRGAKMATAIMHAEMIARTGSVQKRGPVTTPQLAAIDAFIGDKTTVAKTLDVSVNKLAAFALGADDTDTAAAVRRFGALLTGGTESDTGVIRRGDGLRTNNKTAGLSKLGGRKLAAALTALAAERGQKITGVNAPKITAARKTADAAIAKRGGDK